MANGFGTFDLGQIISTAEAIKSARRQSALDALREQYLGEQIKAAQQSREQQATQFSQDQQIANTRLLNAAAAEVSRNPAAISRWLPQLQQAGIGFEGDITQMPPERIQSAAQQIFESTSQALRALNLSTMQPTEAPASVREWQFFSNLSPDQQERYLEMKRSLQIETINQVPTVVRGSGMQPLSTLQSEAQSAATVAGAEALARESAKAGVELSAEQQKRSQEFQRTLQQYEQARQGLMQGLAGTTTGPIVGRAPALTSGQQIAEGGVAAMAPVLKQIFRVAGEGVFTDRDQQLLLDMVPKRTDTPEARLAKMQNIDNIVRAKLGMSAQQSAQPAQGSVQFIYVPGQGLQRANR